MRVSVLPSWDDESTSLFRTIFLSVPVCLSVPRLLFSTTVQNVAGTSEHAIHGAFILSVVKKLFEPALPFCRSFRAST